MTEQVKRVYAFGKNAEGVNATEGNKDMKYVLGGKGANLAEMANIGLPVPPGFTITCQTCMEYSNAGNAWPEGALDEIAQYRADLEERMGKKIGDAEDPLLVSVRSGAPMSMPGMMDTVLNLGLNDQSINGLIKQTENPRFAWDSYRRFIQMFSNVVMNLDGDLFENAIIAMKNDRGVLSDTDLTAEDLQELVGEFKQIFKDNVVAADYPSLVVDGVVQFPQDPTVQLQLAIEAVFGSWGNPRAVLYRQKNKIADDLGTAVNVQSMVFGNKGNTSATGVAFTRNPANGEKEFYGDYLVNAQGEDVVAGIRNTSPIAELKYVSGLEKAGQELEDIFVVLENHFRDMCDIEFTIEQGKLWMLQTRVGKRTAAAALRIAIEMQKEGLISKQEAVLRVDPDQLDQLLHLNRQQHFGVVRAVGNKIPSAAVLIKAEFDLSVLNITTRAVERGVGRTAFALIKNEHCIYAAGKTIRTGEHIERVAVTLLTKMMNKKNGNLQFFRKLFENFNLVVVRSVADFASGVTDYLERINHNQHSVGMLRNKILDLFFQTFADLQAESRKENIWSIVCNGK